MTNHLDRSHPVRELYLEAALGRQPTKARLTEALNRDDLPEGADLTRFRARIAKEAAKVAATHGPGDGTSSNYSASRDLADTYVARIADDMSDDELTATGENPATAEPLADIASRLFGV